MTKISRRVFRQLIDKVISDRCIMKARKGKVGQYLQQLNPEERAALQDLKSQDVQKDFIPFDRPFPKGVSPLI